MLRRLGKQSPSTSDCRRASDYLIERTPRNLEGAKKCVEQLCVYNDSCFRNAYQLHRLMETQLNRAKAAISKAQEVHNRTISIKHSIHLSEALGMDEPEQTRKDLERDIVRWEGQSLEFTEELTEPRELAKEIAAFATSNAGRIYIGVDDDGNVVGVSDITGLNDIKGKDEYQKRIQGITQGLDPPVRVQVSFVEKDSRVVVRIDVPKGPEPVYYVGGRPYLRDLNSSRLARSSEVKDLYAKGLPLSPPIRKVDELQSYSSMLLGITSDIDLILTTYRDSLIDPDLSQMLYDIGRYAEALFEMSKVKPASDLHMEKVLTDLSECLSHLARHQFYIGTKSTYEFGEKAQTCLGIVYETRDKLQSVLSVQSIAQFSRQVATAFDALAKDWDVRRVRFETGNVELLKEAFRRSAFMIYRLAYYPEAKQLKLADDLSSLGLSLRQLSSTEKYFAYWIGADMLKRIETKYGECEQLMSLIRQKLS
jgi:hypothetical protein